jgi:hypothetical protein
VNFTKVETKYALVKFLGEKVFGEGKVGSQWK